MREPVDEQADVDRTRAQTFSEKSETYETQGIVAGAMAAVPTFGPPAEPGEVGVLGPYRVIRELGKGGMGAVYAALDTRLDRKIALKVMLPSYAAIPSAKERFLREARAAAKVAHDNVVTVYEADDRNGVPYIAMQYLEGYPLDEYLKKKGEIDLPQILRIARETAAGLEAAHKLGLIHRDIKPGNLWLEAPNGRVKLLDFGLARPVDSDIELTKSGVVVGTPAYMSPEQAQGERVDARSDLFSLGVMLYRLGTGQLPFPGNTTMAVLMALGTKEPVPVRSLKPELPESFARLVHDLLAKDPDRRPQSATDVIRRLRDLNRNPNSLPVASLPQVSMVDAGPAPSYVPIPIGMASMVNPFENIDITDSVTVDPKPRPEPKASKPGNRKPYLIGGALAALLLLVGGVVIVIRNKDGAETKIEVPDGATVTVKDKGGKTLAKVGPKPAVDSSPDRKAAEWVLSVGGTVRVNREERDLTASGDLPNGSFTLSSVNFVGRSNLSDAGLSLLAPCRELRNLFLERTPITDAGLTHFVDRTSLHAVDLGFTKVTDAGLAHLKGHAEMSYINLTATGVTDAGLVHLKDHAWLKTLGLPSTKVTDAGLVHVTKLARLEYLNLDRTAVSDTGLAQLKECIALTRLDVKGTKVTAKGLADFHAAVPGCKIEHDGGVIEAVDVDRRAAEWVLSKGGSVRINGNNNSVKSAAELPKDRFTLAWADLTKTTVTDKELAQLQELKGLVWLSLGNTSVTDAGLVQLKELKGLLHVRLYGTSVSDTGMVLLKEIKGLTYLDLNYTKVTDAGLKHIQELQKLTELHLNGTQTTDVGLTHLAEIKRLTRLDLRGTKVTAKGLETLHTALPGCRIEHDGGVIEAVDVDRKAAEWVLSVGGKVWLNGNGPDVTAATGLPKASFRLTHVNLIGKRVTAEGLVHLRSCDGLTHLHLEQSGVTDDGLRLVSGLKSLQTLAIDDSAVTDAGLAHVANCKSLTRMNVLRSRVTPKGLADFHAAVPGCKIEHDGGMIEAADPDRKAAEWVISLGGKVQVNGQDRDLGQSQDLPNERFQLTGFSLDANAKVTDAGLANIKDCKGLTNIGLYQTPVGDAGLAHLKDCKQVRVLSLGGTKVTNAGLGLFKDCKDLTWLGLFNTPITDDGLGNFADCKNLKILDLNSTKITDAGIARFRELKSLTVLYLNRTKVTDDGLARFKDSKDLANLFLDGTPITDAGLRHFKDCKGLARLGLSETGAGDDGLALFKDCKELKHLAVRKTKITRKAIESFHAAVPGCRIEYDDGVIEPKK